MLPDRIKCMRLGDKVTWCNRVHVYLCKHPTDHRVHFIKRLKSDAAVSAHYLDIKEIT